MIGDTVNVVHLLQELPELFNRKWLGINFIHAGLDSFLNILIFHMAGDCNDLWLLVSADVSCKEHPPDALGGLIPIEEGHVAVHEYQGVSIGILFVHRLLYLFDGLLAVVGELNHFFPLGEPEYHQEALDDIAVELLVVDHPINS